MSEEPQDIYHDDRKQIEKRDERRRDRDMADFKKVVSMVEGRRVVWRIMAAAGAFRQSFNTNGLQMAFNEGARSIGNLMLMEIMRSAPSVFMQMLREDESDRRSEQAEGKKENKEG